VKIRYVVKLKNGEYISRISEDDVRIFQQTLTNDRFFKLPRLMVNKDDVMFITVDVIEKDSE